MRIAIVVGTRPEIVKMAPVIRAAAALDVDAEIIHTGQHYSWAMDGVFFDELGLPAPEQNLKVGSGSHASQISAIVGRIEQAFEQSGPDLVLVEGDTNSVLGAAITANKMGITVGHVEAGLRSHDRGMPEEINRILVDHLADHLFAPTEAAAATLVSEGIPASRIHVTGNTVVDELMYQRGRVDAGPIRRALGVEGRYALATVHRAENVTDSVRLRGIFAGLDRVARQLELTVLATLHPRTAARLAQLGIRPELVRTVPPLGYLEFLALQVEASLILTDSGGLQEEACSLGVPCVTLRDNTERPESVSVGANLLAGAEPERIAAAAREMVDRPRTWANPFGDGTAGERIVRVALAARPAVAGRSPIPVGEAVTVASDRERGSGEVDEAVAVP